jgi:hypothetical protein
MHWDGDVVRSPVASFARSLIDIHFLGTFPPGRAKVVRTDWQQYALSASRFSSL